MFHDVVSGSDVRAASASAVAVRRMVCYVQYLNFLQTSNAVSLSLGSVYGSWVLWVSTWNRGHRGIAAWGT